MQTWRLDDARQTLVLCAQGGLPQVTYWGAALPQGEDLSVLHAANARDLSGGMLDVVPPLSLCPETTQSFPGQPGLRGCCADGTPLRPQFKLREVVQDGQELRVACTDEARGLTYTATLALDTQTHVLRLQARLDSAAPIQLDWFAAPVLPAPDHAAEMIDVSGRWCGEFQLNDLPWTPGSHLRESLVGRSDHAHFPGLILPCTGTSNTQGAAYALHYGWAGGHRMVAEELPDGRRQVQFGHASGSYAAPATQFETAPLYATFSDIGINGCATAFQRHLRDRIVTTPTPRPVHYNCWEAVYFNHDLPRLKDIATRAAELGAERFVLDDGWFGLRDDDTTSLGDWQVDSRKYPQGLGPLIDHVAGLGMSFGLWLEPEMINRDSALFRAHPDWVLGEADQATGRGQLVLDMARGDVQSYLYDSIAALLRAHPITYIKWDHNRVLPVADVAQTHGLYALLDRLRADFPQVEIESCASGGGRADWGMLERTGRIWLSDSNDALERLAIQHNAALFLPACVTGSHVGPRLCHTSGRMLDIGFRAWVAAQRHMGFEMDPRELTAHEAQVLRDVTTWWKANRDWMMMADILRLDSSDAAVIAEQQIAQDGSRFVVFAGRAATSAQIAPRPLRLTGLDPAARYTVTLRAPDSPQAQSRGQIALKTGPVTLSGAALMGQGITLPCSDPGTMAVLEAVRREEAP